MDGCYLLMAGFCHLQMLLMMVGHHRQRLVLFGDFRFHLQGSAVVALDNTSI
jgi:hypothetical protein